MQPKIGFIGLGVMGAPISKNLLKAGYRLAVWDRVDSRVDHVADAGAHAATSPRDVACQSEVTITMVVDSADVEEVVLGPNGIVEEAARGSVVIDMSTISPDVTKAIAQRLRKKEVHMLDAPVSGGPQGAADGTLSIMVGGDQTIFERCMPIFDALGSRVTLCGDNGMGTTAKLANQIIGLGNLAALCEGALFATRAGMELDSLVRAVGGGAASNSWMVENLGPKIAAGDFSSGTHPKMSIVDKDLRLVIEAAAEMDLPLFTTPLVGYICRTATHRGLGDRGIQTYLEVLTRFAGMATSGDAA